jgi:endo-1,4-beta-xylanase
MDGHRTARATLTVTADGEPLAGREVLVAQRSHEFLFGCTAFEFSALADAAAAGEPAPPDAAESADRWLDLFNFATLPFYRYAGSRTRPGGGAPHSG